MNSVDRHIRKWIGIGPLDRAFGLLVLLVWPLCGWSQARLILNNDAWVRIDNGAWVVLENPATTGIQTLGTGGNIRSEGEFNRIRWQIRNSTGTYVVPFTTSNGVKMPLTYQVTAAGSNEATASICFSTYNYGAIAGTNWNNDLYRPSDVTHMNNYWLGAPVNNSDNVVDRFWEIDPGVAGFAYGTKPDINLTFTVDPGAATGDIRPGNAITGATQVGAQRFNTPANMWGDMWPQGVFAAGAVNTVSNASINGANFFRSWTLSNILEPLPVELVRFDAVCDKDLVRLTWTTGSESGNSHFVVERSADGVLFEAIAEVPGAGNSQIAVDYLFVDDRPIALAYYQLRQVDFDGTETLGPLRAAGCSTTGTTQIVNAWDDGNELNVLVHAAADGVHLVRLFDASGKVVWNTGKVALTEGLNTISFAKQSIAMGIYTIRFDGPQGTLVRRVNIY
ncbi:MAG: T9SS type A sorting domain-containing protein [Flavobacteriales bacterium]